MAEIKQCKEKHGRIIQSECHYTNSTIEEVLRFKPAVASLMHRTVKSFYFEGHFIPAGSLVLGSIPAVHFNPEIFPEPKAFKADRFLVDGKFKVSVIFVSEN